MPVLLPRATLSQNRFAAARVGNNVRYVRRISLLLVVAALGVMLAFAVAGCGSGYGGGGGGGKSNTGKTSTGGGGY